MAKHILVVLTNAADGRDEEFNKWYDEVHLKEVMAAPGFVASTRYQLADAQIMDNTPYKYLAIYEIEGDDPSVTIEAMRKRAGTLNMSDSLDTNALANLFSPITERIPAKR